MTHQSHAWKFFRAGGFEQVRIDTAADLLALGELDQKLWVALSCPVAGTEFDARTLALVDGDGDGHIRAPELIAAIGWAAERLDDAETLARGLAGVPLAAIRTDDDLGAKIAAAAQALAAELGKGDDALVSVEEAGAAQARFAAKALAAWEAQGAAARPLGEASEEALAALQAVAEKVEDYFVRCRLAAFDARAAGALNAADEAFAGLAPQLLAAEAAGIAALPIARIEAGRPLPLGEGANPAWAQRLARLRDAVVTPLLGARDALSEADWRTLAERFAAYLAWRAAKPDAATVGNGVLELERLARYVRDLLPLANNFVAFKDFYTRQGKATFQAGTLYLDGRSCELCVAVNDAAKHAALATLSRICLVYCECTRRGDAGAEKTAIAAAFTAGDADQLMVGRNGVFYDRQGRDWDATITKIVEHPISLRQAFWSPYKKLARLIGEQLQKLAASKAAGVEGGLAATAGEVGKKAEAPARPVAQQAFDIGKFAGIFAAIGLAVGAIGTALAAVLAGLLALAWWQIPIAIAGLMLMISTPAVILAWFKLRSRNLGPILDANGWAVNARARINIPFGTSLTGLARLPEGAERALTDPYAEKRPPWGLYFGILAALVLAAFVWYVKRSAQ